MPGNGPGFAVVVPVLPPPVGDGPGPGEEPPGAVVDVPDAPPVPVVSSGGDPPGEDDGPGEVEQGSTGTVSPSKQVGSSNIILDLVSGVSLSSQESAFVLSDKSLT